MKQTLLLVFLCLLSSAFALEQMKHEDGDESCRPSECYEFTENVNFNDAVDASDFGDVPSQRSLTLEVNKQVDEVLKFVNKLLIEEKLDSMALPEVHERITKKILLKKFHGKFDLTDGHLEDIASFSRAGDAKVTLGSVINVQLPLAMGHLKADYHHYRAKIWKLSISGKLEGRVKDLKMMVDVSVDLKARKVIVNSFKLTNAKISIKFHGNKIVDWLLNMISKIAMRHYNDKVVKMASSRMEEALRKAADKIGNKLPKFMEKSTDKIYF